MDADERVNYMSEAVSVTGFPPLKAFQSKVLLELLDGKDVFATAPTGHGKSGCYQIAPFAFASKDGTDTSVEGASPIVLVVEPLISLMRDQIQAVRKRGIRAGMLSSPDDRSAIASGSCSLVYGAPESFLTKNTRELLLTPHYQQHVKLLVVDESHCIKKLSENAGKSVARAFRRHYARLGELRAMCSADVPVLALTATASKDTAAVIKTRMAMDTCVVVKEPSNKENIRYYFERASADHAINFRWLIDILRDQGRKTPRHIVFFSSSDVLARVYRIFQMALREKGFDKYNIECPEKNDDTNRLFVMYHSQVPPHIKETVHKSVSEADGHVRVMLCTNAFGMGVDVKGADTVMHYGPSKDPEEYLQETGRVARVQEENGLALLVFYPRSDARGCSAEMKKFMRTKECRRAILLKAVDEERSDNLLSTHGCCDNCHKQCTCSGDKCLVEEPSCVTAIREAANHGNSSEDDSSAVSSSEGSEDSKDSDDSDISINFVRKGVRKMVLPVVESDTDSDSE